MNSLDDMPIGSNGGVVHDLSFATLFDQNYPGLLYFSFKLIGDKEEAEDIVQNAFISYWKGRDTVQGELNAIKSYLYTTVRHSCMDLLKHRTVIKKHRDQLDADPIDDRLVENEIIRSEVLSEIFNAIENLPAGCRQVLEMSYWQGKKNLEISEELGVSVNTVKTQKQRALQLLRLKLAPSALLVFLQILPAEL
ncbi:RNA polymerase sigma-70 factor (ECF subfamily) [Dyadobacter jejuensis]|uniref:RNA polymerase sigma-70 factor (ECF subfamily) n=1 Tax=Dyadobacter jejuensis TaxID=1082580 RepID=A0A316AN78_9BACT|nr:RNA polymerase sigma-70 factor [Dyadobacter jejuensis]PWJ58574.1 RNA polymerase sigma-70 factor (ECF subfamily) [Dyadobacter jejuensis]